MFAPPIAGDDMVQGKLMRFLAAVLAGMVVTVENLQAGQLPLKSRALNHMGNSDYRGYGESIAG